MRTGGLIAAVALALGGAGAVAAASGAADGPTAGASATRTVKVADNFFSPKRLSVVKDTTVKWVWSNRNADTHDVYLDKRPKGAARFQSDPAATHFTYKRKLRKVGTYKILCTFHEDMSMRIDVKRP